MDAIVMLREDHKKVEKLFKEFEKVQDKDGTEDERANLVREISVELLVHADVEEKIFYPAARKEGEDLNDDVLEGLEEHRIVKRSIMELKSLKPTDESYNAKVKVLMEMVRHHVEEEEKEMFSDVREELTRKRLQELGDTMESLKETAMKKISNEI